MLGQKIAKELKKCNNPTDLKESLYGVVTCVEPLVVAIENGGGVLTEGDELDVGESFRLRCDINKTKALTDGVSADLEAAKAISETHSQGGAPCGMPQAVAHLASAIEKINAELLQFGCDLQTGHRVHLAPHKEQGKYVLIEKVLSDVS